MFRETTNPAQDVLLPAQRIMGKTMRVWMDILSAEKIQPPTKQKLSHFLQSNYLLSEEITDQLIRHFLMLSGTDGGAVENDGIEITATRTFSVGIHVLENYFTEPNHRLEAFLLELKPLKYNPGKNIRFQLENNEVLVANFNGKSAEKCQVTLQHTKLADAARAEAMRSFWKDRLQVLSELLSGNDKR
jgi:hypothetical protein